MSLRRTLLFVLSFCLITGSFAQEQGQPVKTLSFKEAVKIGLQNNALFIQQKNQLEYTQVNKTSALLQMGPSVNAGFDAYRNDGNSFNSQQGRVVNGVVDYVGGRISASMPVFSGFSYVNQYRSANAQNEAQLYKVARSSQDAIATVSSQYLLCLLDQELVKVAEENVRVQKVTYDQIKEQAALGAKAEADAYSQEYLWRNAELQLISSKNTLTNDLAAFAVTLLVDPAVYQGVEQIDWDINELLIDSTTYELMHTTALDRRADLRQARFAEKGAKLNVATRRGFYFPNISANATYRSQYNYIQGAPDSINRSFSDQFRNDNTQLNYGFTLNIPIFNNWTNKSQTAQAKVLYKNAQLFTKTTQVTVSADVLKANKNFSNARKRYVAAKAQQAAGEYAYKMEKERYDLGISNIVQLSTVNQSYVRSQAEYQQALYTLMFQKILVDYAMGTLQFEDIP